jgi:hypothetical protein
MRRIRGPGASLQSPRGYAPARRQHGAAIPYACRNVRPPRGRLDAAKQYRFALRPDVAEVNNNSASCLRHAASSRRRLGAFSWRWHGSRTSSTPTTISRWRVFLSVGQAGDALDALRRALAVGETTPSKALFVQCARWRISGTCGRC